MSTINAAETIDVLVRVHGRATDEVVAGLADVFAAGVESVAPSLELATRAGEMRARLFDRRARRLSLADCFVLATAAEHDFIATTDAVLAEAARAEGIPVVELDA
jgi:predicted nucleic acid-binding protein